MKIRQFFSMIIFSAFLFSAAAFAQEAADVAPSIDIPGWEWVGTAITVLLQALSSIPAVGSWLVPVTQVIGIIAGILTVLSAAATACFKLPQLVAKWSGATEVAEKIELWSNRILPWIKYLSMFNVQKKK